MEWLVRVIERIPLVKKLLFWILCRVVFMGTSHPFSGGKPFRTNAKTCGLHYGWQQEICQATQPKDCGRSQRRWHQIARGICKLLSRLTKQMLDCCEALGIHTVTAFAFSLDNFKRSEQEVGIGFSAFTLRLPIS
jgi:hypothetical protein